jgi:hypothetical protein
MQVNLSLTPGYRLKITRASRMSELVDRVITGLAALGGSAAFLEILRRWLQRRQEKRQEQLQLDVRIMDEGHALRQEAYQREREALRALAEVRERRHKAELAALEAQMQAGGSDAGQRDAYPGSKTWPQQQRGALSAASVAVPKNHGVGGSNSAPGHQAKHSSTVT